MEEGVAMTSEKKVMQWRNNDSDKLLTQSVFVEYRQEYMIQWFLSNSSADDSLYQRTNAASWVLHQK